MVRSDARPNVDYGPGEVARENEILRGLVGSTLHGTALDGQDDRDEMGISIEPPAYALGLHAVDVHNGSTDDSFTRYVFRTQPEGARSGPGDTDLVIYSLRRWLSLAVSGNPSVLLLFWVPDDALIVRTEEGDRLRALAPAVVSQQAGERFLRYLRNQAERMDGLGRRNRVPNRPELVAAHGYDTKYAAQALRLGLQGFELMTTGRLSLPMRDEDREQVMAIRRGDVDKATAREMIDMVARDLADLLDSPDLPASSPLPLRPDLDAVNDYLAQAHRRAWGWAA
ncbi:hypothetical protein CcI49_26830 [Frankia sp. CcI49]|uniref:DNA polymerase beta superfamily protein n=1 Tax=unclassified Frankia TaxID=2632575 RepID=UPI0006CA4D76|nr:MULTISPECIES: nucleotidyltransferase domain-containing protein [unclassified Frankia]KPM56685.1 hypothetical protein ACG83_01990 [Frankia sp. R43]ONH57040.1 hypothetical protein CcI49_26830 [Frankia sp. CcI49]